MDNVGRCVRRAFALVSIIVVFRSPPLHAQFLLVTAKSATIRAAPNSGSTGVVSAHAGDIFKLEGDKDGWYQISMFGGEYRYIFHSLAQPIDTAPALPGDLDVRRRVFVELVHAQDRAVSQAQRRFPSDYSSEIDYERLLYDRYELPILERYHVTPARYTSLIVEGAKKNWIPN